MQLAASLLVPVPKAAKHFVKCSTSGANFVFLHNNILTPIIGTMLQGMLTPNMWNVHYTRITRR